MTEQIPIDEADYAEPRMAITGDDAQRLWRQVQPRSGFPARRLLAGAAAVALLAGLVISVVSRSAGPASIAVSCEFATGPKSLTIPVAPALGDEAVWRQICGSPGGFALAVLEPLQVCQAGPQEYVVRFGANRTC